MDCDSVLGTKSRDEIIEGMEYYDFNSMLELINYSYFIYKES